MPETVVQSVAYDDMNDKVQVTRIIKGAKVQVITDLLDVKVEKATTLSNVLNQQGSEVFNLKLEVAELKEKLSQYLIIQQELAKALKTLSDSVQLINDKLSLEGRL